jgi:hypothetical protein
MRIAAERIELMPACSTRARNSASVAMRTQCRSASRRPIGSALLVTETRLKIPAIFHTVATVGS